MKVEYIEKLEELRMKEVRTPAEEALMAALIDLEAKEKTVPYDKVAVQAAKEVVEEAEGVE